MSDYSAVAQNQSQAYAAALQRAKQIAAKIQPNQPQGGGGGGFKRSSNEDPDMGPEIKRFSGPGSDYGQNSNSNMSTGSGGGGSNAGSGGGQGNMSQAIAQAAAVAARIAATAGTTCEEQVRIPDSIVNAMTGRGSNDTISHIQGDSGCKVQLSQDTGPTGYPPYQEIMIPGTKVGLVIGKGGDTIKQLQEKTGAKMVIIQEGPNQEVIKPLRISGDPQKIEHAKQLVLELIAAKDSQSQPSNRNSLNTSGGASNNGGGGNYNNFGNGGGGEQCEVFVPKIAVGVVIGKGGDMIRKIQMECGCKLQFIQGKNDEPGDRRCLIQGTKQQVEDAKRTIDGLIENVMQRNRNGGGGGGGGGGPGNSNDNSNSNYGYGYGVNHAQQPPREEITFMVPASKCGIVIGRGGETIKLINQQSGAYCEMDRNAVNPPSEKLFKCKGSSEQVEAARQMIAEKINMELTILSRKPISGGGPNQQHNQGNYGNQMQNDPNSYQQQQWGGYGQQGWGDQSQQMAAMGQNPAAAAGQQAADYSAQWIEYYKSMGMHREAEMIEQQLKAKQAVAAPTQPVAMPHVQPQQQQQTPAAVTAAASSSVQDYSAQWAEYYRSIGKIEEAEAIEKQMKQTQGGQSAGSAPVSNNAMGVGSNNPSGSVPGAPGVGNPAAAPGGGQPPQQQQQHGYPQSMTPSQYAQYSQYYAAAAAAAGGYPQPGYGGYGAPGGYPGAPQPPGPNNGPQQQQQQQQPPKGNKPDKN